MASGVSDELSAGKAMRRFVLTYTQDDVLLYIEGIMFSNDTVVLEYKPLSDWPGPKSFYNLENMHFQLNEFGETSIRWIDKQEATNGSTS